MIRLFFLSILFSCTFLLAQPIPKEFYQDLSYRCIGPFRAGRTVGAVGIPAQPNVFFMGVNNGGVWKTDDYGRTWNPIFDKESTGSIGDLAVSLSNPQILYVGTGEGLHRPDLSTGDGIFKSIDGGKNWSHVGLSDIQQVSRVIIHPTDPNIVFVGGLGHPYGPNEERGVFRTTDGGKTWKKVLYINHNTGAIQVEFDPQNPKVLYANLWEHREGPWENASFSGKNSGIYKSIDGGNTWKQLTKGLPGANEGLGRIGIGISYNNPKIIYATVDARVKGGIYKSIDAGESWSLITSEPRLWGRGSDFAEVKVHPKDPNRLYIGNTASYQSNDGGKSWFGLKGAPGGDDYHRIWINPIQPDIMLFAADQGATITVNGGRTWSSWYNQPTAQLYHVSVDNQFPYYVYGGQQESGAIAVASRGPGGQISLRDWIGIGADEYSYVAPDPLNPDIIYGGRIIKFNKKTGQSQNVAPEALRSGKYRTLRTMPLLFHPMNPHTLLYATNVLWKTTNGGQSWAIISPDLSRESYDIPKSIGDFSTPDLATMPRRGVIYSVSASPLHEGTIWAGTDDGLIHVTTDGGQNWKNVTPPALSSWDKIAQLDAGHFDKNTCYVSVNSFRKDDLSPHLYKTHDGGKNWTKIVNGIPTNGAFNVIREDIKQPGLLFAGNEREVYFSVDDGINWQSLRNNMPPSSIRDLVIKDNDLVIGTHGRSIWILDNFSSLRELASLVQSKKYHLFNPATAYRVRDNMFHDTPFPPEEPAGQNPPDGATLDYYLPNDAKLVSIKIQDTYGTIREYTSNDPNPWMDTTSWAYPTYWLKPHQTISTKAGHHRIVWDLKKAPLPGISGELSIAAVYKKTPLHPQGPYVYPGSYTVIFNADGTEIKKEIRVKMDPRVTIPEQKLLKLELNSSHCYDQYLVLEDLKNKLKAMIKSSSSETKTKLESILGSGSADIPDQVYGSITAAMTPDKETIVSLQSKYYYILNVLQSADAAPTAQLDQAIKSLDENFKFIQSKVTSIIQ